MKKYVQYRNITWYCMYVEKMEFYEFAQKQYGTRLSKNIYMNKR